MKVSSLCFLGVIIANASSIVAFAGQTSRITKASGLHVATIVEGTRSAESADFPPPLTPIEKFQRAATFWSVALPIVANYYGLIGNLRLQELLGSPMSDDDVEVRNFLFLGYWVD